MVLGTDGETICRSLTKKVSSMFKVFPKLIPNITYALVMIAEEDFR